MHDVWKAWEAGRLDSSKKCIETLKVPMVATRLDSNPLAVLSLPQGGGASQSGDRSGSSKHQPDMEATEFTGSSPPRDPQAKDSKRSLRAKSLMLVADLRDGGGVKRAVLRDVPFGGRLTAIM